MLSKEPESEECDATKIIRELEPGPKKETYETWEVIETYCNQWGCGKKLSLMETLLGNKCIEHSGIKPLKWSN